MQGSHTTVTFLFYTNTKNKNTLRNVQESGIDIGWWWLITDNVKSDGDGVGKILWYGHKDVNQMGGVIIVVCGMGKDNNQGFTLTYTYSY